METISIYQWLDYDAWATAQLLEAVEQLSPQQFVHEFAGSLSSVRQQFVHLLSVADRYRARLAEEEVPDTAADSIATTQDLIIYAMQVRQRLNIFLDGLAAEDLSRIHQHATRRGSYSASLEQTLGHMVNHATYHRGQVACLLKLHGVNFADTDFIIWINPEMRSTPASAQGTNTRTCGEP
jgi:uncharacterized damage-inducible protein DinB